MDEDYYSVNADTLWRDDRPLVEGDRKPYYYRQEIADVCLHCKYKQCIKTDGCDEYRAAEKKAGRNGNSLKCVPSANVTANGITKTLGEWADQLGVSYLSVYIRAKRYSRTLAQEIETRLREAGKWKSVALNGQMSRN